MLLRLLTPHSLHGNEDGGETQEQTSQIRAVIIMIQRVRREQGVDLPPGKPQYSNETNGEVSLLSFIVHLWKEDSTAEEPQNEWRGYITPIPKGARQYFTNISQIPNLIRTHLKSRK